MPYQTQIREHLRAQKLKVIEVAGWQTRGSSIFDPKGSVNHHTAGARSGNHPSLGILINGRHDLPGPLCNVSLARNGDVYLIAAGRANHAGSGSWLGVTGNSSMWGLEVEHTGSLASEPAPTKEFMNIMHRIHVAFMQSSGFGVRMVCQHFEWTSRKIDFIGVNGNGFRSEVSQVHDAFTKPVPPPTTIPKPGQVIQEEDMKTWLVRGPKGDVYLFNGQTLRPANNATYRQILRFHGTLGDPWFQWDQASIDAVPKA